jgi:hypothetical protein
VWKVDVDAKEDTCLIAYEPERVTPEQLLESIRGTGFEGVIREAKNGESP